MPTQQYATRQLGRNGPLVSAMGFGTMGELRAITVVFRVSLELNNISGIGAFYGKTDKEEAMKTLTYAADRGVTFWDTADIYGDSTFSELSFFPFPLTN